MNSDRRLAARCGCPYLCAVNPEITGEWTVASGYWFLRGLICGLCNLAGSFPIRSGQAGHVWQYVVKQRTETSSKDMERALLSR